MITPMDIHNKTFSGQIRGYSKDEVNAFLEELASDYEKIYREHRAMEEEMDAIRTKLRNYEKMESTMSNTLIMAQETADNVKKNAHKEAELSVREAQNEAQKIVSDAEAARRKMNADLLKAEGDMNLYIEKLLSNFKSALALIESAKSVKAPQTIQTPITQPSQPAAPVEEKPVESVAETPAEATPEETPAPVAAAEETEEISAANLFDHAEANRTADEKPAAEETKE